MSVQTRIRDSTSTFTRNYRLPSVNDKLTPKNDKKIVNIISNNNAKLSQKSRSVSSATLYSTGSKDDSPQKLSGVSAVTNKLRNLSFTGRNQSTNDLKRPQSTFPRFLTTSTCSVPSACNSLEDIAKYFVGKNVQKVVVMVGAGISTDSGIPDFRSPGSGLYDNLKQYKIPFPEAIFDLDFFQSNPRPFFTLAKELYPNGHYRPNMVHYFLRLLYDKGRLHRIYTQNIDGLERLAGIPPEKLVEAHGTFSKATCQRCGLKYKGSDVKVVIENNEIPRCSVNNCQGVIKPDIVFFGEDLPLRFYSYMSDFREADMLLVMGTSLAVEPFAGIVDATRAGVPRVLFNREPVGVFKRKTRAHDVVSSGDVVSNILSFTEFLSWKDELETLKDTNETASLAMLAAAEEKAKKDTPTTDKEPSRTLTKGGGNTKPSPTAPSIRPFNRGYSTHAPLVPISQPRLPRLSGPSRPGQTGTGRRPNVTTTRFQRRPPPGPPRRKNRCSSSSSSSSSSSDSSSSSSS